jgi:hypothetical protein
VREIEGERQNGRERERERERESGRERERAVYGVAVFCVFCKY